MISQVTDMIKATHSYSVPEVIALPIIGGSSDYLDWVGKATQERENFRMNGSVPKEIASDSNSLSQKNTVREDL